MDKWVYLSIIVCTVILIIGFVIWNTTNDVDMILGAIVIAVVAGLILQIGTYFAWRNHNDKEKYFAKYKERYGMNVREIHANWGSNDVIIFTRHGMLCSVEAGPPNGDARNIIIDTRTVNCENSKSLDEHLFGPPKAKK